MTVPPGFCQNKLVRRRTANKPGFESNMRQLPARGDGELSSPPINNTATREHNLMLIRQSYRIPCARVLTGFEAVDDADGNPSGCQARCRRCELTAWVEDSGLIYSLSTPLPLYSATRATGFLLPQVQSVGDGRLAQKSARRKAEPAVRPFARFHLTTN